MVLRCFLGGAVCFLGLLESRTGDDPMVLSWDPECTDDRVTTAEAFGPGETEIFFSPRTGRFSALDDSASKTVSPELGHSRLTYHKLVLFRKGRCRRNRRRRAFHRSPCERIGGFRVEWLCGRFDGDYRPMGHPFI